MGVENLRYIAIAGALTSVRLARPWRGGFLGDETLYRSFSFDVDLVVGKPNYVCGEEIAPLNPIDTSSKAARLEIYGPGETGSWCAGRDSPRKGSLSARETSGQNSRSMSTPMPWSTLKLTRSAAGAKPR